MKENKEFGPVMELVAGCPFTNFEKCKGEKCAFFVKTFSKDPDDARDCILRSLFFHQMCSNMVFLLERGIPSNSRDPSLGPLFSQRVAELIGDFLRNLDGLLIHPKTADSTKENIRVLKLKILEQVKTFAEP